MSTANLSVTPDARIRIEVSPNRTQVFMHLRNELVKAGITTGILDTALEHLAARHQQGGAVTPVLVARGVLPVNGEGSHLEFCINLGFSHAPLLLDNGQADYFSLHRFESVTAGQELARIVPPTPGTPGTDVFGATLPAEPGRFRTHQAGPNVAASAADPLTLISTRSGHASLHKGCMVVHELLTIDSAVDFETGNIDFAGDVVIGGDVKSGFVVKTKGNVLVRGTVEDARIEAGKSVVVHGGFVGRGKGRIKAGHDVVVRHIRNQTIMARNNILIAGEALDANLYAGNEMFVEIRKSWIVGGRAVARSCIRSWALGSPSHTPTSVTVGMDAFIKRVLDQIETEIEELEERIGSMRQEQLSSADAAPAPHTLCEAIDELARKNRRLATYRTRYRAALNEAQGFVAVLDRVYPGVAIRIGPCTTIVSQETRRSRFTAQGSTITTTPWADRDVYPLDRVPAAAPV